MVCLLRTDFNLDYANNDALLSEWLYYHLMQGVGHIYVYTFTGISQTVNLQPEQWWPFIERGLVTHIHWPMTRFCELNQHNHKSSYTTRCDIDQTVQFWAYNHYLYNFGEFSNYTVVVDVDEFMARVFLFFLRQLHYTDMCSLHRRLHTHTAGCSPRWIISARWKRMERLL
jgi:hypothetical protein